MKPPGVDLLVIGYGNTLRRDDGVGVKVAEAVAEMDLPGVKVIARHQLVPELAGPISEARNVLFVDAALNTPVESGFIPVDPASTNLILAHATSPASLLGLAGKFYGHSPKAWTLAIPAEDFGFGEDLSPRTRAGLQAALKKIRELASQPPV